MQKERKLILENGIEFIGEAFGGNGECIAELVFNTSMVGYQEILSDPGYTGQMLMMTYPLIGNYGIIDEDYDSKLFGPKGLIVREYNDKPSNFRYTKTLNELLEENDIPGITHIDTRKLTNILREEGTMKAMLCDIDVTAEEALTKMKQVEPELNPTARVSCRKKWYSRCANPNFNVVALDFGITYSAIRELNHYGCNVTIVPYNTSASQILEMKPDGIFLSDGPGNPEEVKEGIQLVRDLQGKKPVFGVSLSHQLIALANGLTIEKMKFGHHGGNHPVKNLQDNSVVIASQNHSYVVDGTNAQREGVEITHINLLDNTVEGLEIKKERIFSVQYHPDAAVSPIDTKKLFEKFISNMQEAKEER